MNVKLFTHIALVFFCVVPLHAGKHHHLHKRLIITRAVHHEEAVKNQEQVLPIKVNNLRPVAHLKCRVGKPKRANKVWRDEIEYEQREYAQEIDECSALSIGATKIEEEPVPSSELVLADDIAEEEENEEVLFNFAFSWPDPRPWPIETGWSSPSPSASYDELTSLDEEDADNEHESASTNSTAVLSCSNESTGSRLDTFIMKKTIGRKNHYVLRREKKTDPRILQAKEKRKH